MPKQRLTKRADGRFQRYYHGHYFYGKTQAEATAKMEQFKRNEEMGLRQHNTVSVADFAARWLPVAKADVERKHYNDCAHQLDKMCAVIGTLPIKDIKTTDVLSVYVLYVGYSESTIKRARNVFISMFDAAQEEGLIILNPFRNKKAQPHEGTAGTHRSITEDERAMIMNTDHRMQDLSMVMLFSGLRRG